MGDYFVFFMFAQLYGMITGTVAVSTSPWSIAGYKMYITVQFILVTATFVYPFFDPICSVSGIIAWVIYCVFMYLCFFSQMFDLRGRVIDTDQIYECKLFAKSDKENESVYFGEIKPWKDTITVMLISTKEYHKGDIVKVIYKERNFQRINVRKKNEEKQRYETVSVVFRVVPADD